MALIRTNTIFLLIFILINASKSEGLLEEKYYFQLYPSESKEKPFLFHAYTPNSKFITINSTEGETCKILENRTVNEYPIKDLSSVIVYNKSILIKTCFGPDNIVEITDEKNETFYHKNNNIGTGQKSLDKLKFCYSTAIFNPLNKNEYAIMTYWTDYVIEKGIEKYVHKCIIFDPKTKTFSQEKVLTYNSNLIERLINNNYYAKSCITIRATDIFCSINLDSDTSYGNSFIIDTAKIYSSEPQINLIFSNKKFGENIYQKPIAIGKEIHDIFGGLYDAFLTEYHDEEKDKIILVSSLFRKSLHVSFISLADKSKKYYGINVENSYIDQNLFNHLLPNENDLIIIYTMKTRDGMGLVMTRLNLTTSITYHKSFKEYSLSNYLREDICSRPRHIQSIFVNSFINYNEGDKSKIKNFGEEKFYKYQKDIVTLLACEDDNKNVFYQSKKIIMPQCLNVLDEINNKDYHYIKYKDDENNVTLDIYNDPNLISLRNITIEFLPIDIKGDPIIIMVKTEKTNYTYINHTKTNIIVNPTHIRIFRTINFNTKEALELPYRLKKTSFMESAITCHLSSDICKFDLIKINDDECNIDYCIFCEKNICKKCKDSIEGILLDNKNNRCVCDINNGFKLYPQTFYSNFEMCICEENYSFYKNISLCRPNSELNNGSYYKDRIDDISLIPIYDDCPKDCENCQVKNTTDNKKVFICPNGNEIEMTDEPFLPDKDDICLDENKDDKIWFEYEEHKFYYAKIEHCVYIIYHNSLFFYSNKTDCIFSDSADTEYISKCLNISTINDYDEYKAFIEDSKEYNPNEESITIYRRINNFNLHLVNGQKSNDFSELEISPECENKLKDFYQINNDLKLLVFKVDITQENYFVIQVEYSFYNPEPRKIYEKLDLYKCSLNENETEIEAETETETERKLNNEYPILKLNETNILYPINLTELQRQHFEELKKYNVFLFDSNEDFYNDVCFKFTTLKKNDIYIDDRRKNYYIYDRVCSPNCTAVDFDLETDNIKCQCPLKYEHQSPEEITDIENPFKEKVIAPNLQVMKCPNQAYGTAKNFGLFFNFILEIAFLLLCIYRKCCSIPKTVKSLYSMLEKETEEKKKEKLKNLLEGLEEEEEDSDDEFPHKLKAKPKQPPADEPDDHKHNEDDDDELKKEEVSIKESTQIQKRSIKNKKRNKENNEDINDKENKKIKMNPKQEESKIKASVINMNNNAIKGNNDSEDPKEDEKSSNNNNFIELNRDNIENKSKSSEKEKEEEEGASEVKSKKEKKPKRKRSKSKKNIKKDSDTNSDGSDDENEKQTKKRKKSKSKPKKKKKKLKGKENNENNSESEDEKDKKKTLTPPRIILKAQ